MSERFYPLCGINIVTVGFPLQGFETHALHPPACPGGWAVSPCFSPQPCSVAATHSSTPVNSAVSGTAGAAHTPSVSLSERQRAFQQRD